MTARARRSGVVMLGVGLFLGACMLVAFAGQLPAAAEDAPGGYAAAPAAPAAPGEHATVEEAVAGQDDGPAVAEAPTPRAPAAEANLAATIEDAGQDLATTGAPAPEVPAPPADQAGGGNRPNQADLAPDWATALKPEQPQGPWDRPPAEGGDTNPGEEIEETEGTEEDPTPEVTPTATPTATPPPAPQTEPQATTPTSQPAEPADTTAESAIDLATGVATGVAVDYLTSGTEARIVYGLALDAVLDIGSTAAPPLAGFVIDAARDALVTSATAPPATPPTATPAPEPPDGPQGQAAPGEDKPPEHVEPTADATGSPAWNYFSSAVEDAAVIHSFAPGWVPASFLRDVFIDPGGGHAAVGEPPRPGPSGPGHAPCTRPGPAGRARRVHGGERHRQSDLGLPHLPPRGRGRHLPVRTHAVQRSGRPPRLAGWDWHVRAS